MTPDQTSTDGPSGLREDLNTEKPNRSIIQFFLLTFALTIPFWVIGGVTGLQLLPGLPVAALGTFCPAAAAAILVYRDGRGLVWSRC